MRGPHLSWGPRPLPGPSAHTASHLRGGRFPTGLFRSCSNPNCSSWSSSVAAASRINPEDRHNARSHDTSDQMAAIVRGWGGQRSRYRNLISRGLAYLKRQETPTPSRRRISD